MHHLDQDLIITDPHLCFGGNRKKAIDRIHKANPNVKIDWYFFENNPDSCLSNAKKREKDVESFIKNFAKHYTIPKDATVIGVSKY